MKRWLAGLLCLAMVLGMAGCSKTRTAKEESSTVAAEPQPLQVYYVAQGSSGEIAAALLKYYRLQEGSMEVVGTSFNSAAELQQAVEEGEQQPDVILLDAYSSGAVVELFQWAEDGRLCGLNEYLEADDTYEKENYIAGVMEAGQYGGEQYVIPLSVARQFLLINEDERLAGDLTDLPMEYTGKMLLEAMISDTKEHEGEADYFAQLPYMLSICSKASWLYECLEYSGALHVDRASKTVTVNDEMFQLTMEYFRTLFEESAPLFSGLVNVNDMSFADLEKQCTAVVSNMNVMFASRYMSSACSQLLEQESEVLPYVLADGGYAVNMNVIGVVSAASEQPQAALQFLRTLMDMPYSQWEAISGGDALTLLSPVNRNEALALIDSYESLSGSMFKIQGELFAREELPQEIGDTLRTMTEENRQAFVTDAEVCDVLATYLADYLSGQTDDLDGVAEQVKAAIEAEL